MRAVLLILILAIVALIAAVATGLVDITPRQGAKAPTVAATSNGVVAKGGQAPAFDIETGSVAVGTRTTNVAVPVPEVRVNPAPGRQAPAASSSRDAAAATGNNIM
ncbi:MAG TPA: hypothetical protein VM265_09325 [Sphingomicrobium sp.]|nr:hypothetical protein [Sphingomicrobium sp.]